MQTLPRVDYQDSFGVPIESGDRRPALDWARALFEEQSPLLESLLLFVGWLMRLEPGRLRSEEHVLGIRVAAQTPDAVVLGGDGPAVGLCIVILAPTPTRPLTFTTFVRFHHRPQRLLLLGHRRVVPLLLRRTATRHALGAAAGVAA